MATVLMTWELGGGLGHMLPMQAIGRALVDAGHHIFAAIRDLTYAHRVFSDDAVHCLQAPFKQRLSADARGDILSFSHILWNTGFNDPRSLDILAGAWRGLIQMMKPQLILFDHSPTALLATRGLPVRRILLGTGFAHPPSGQPMPVLRPWLQPDAATLADDERHVLDNANHVLRKHGTPTMNRLADLYDDADSSYITTLPALDPYAPRVNAHYFHPPSSTTGVPPQWPAGSAPRVFGYIKPFPAIESLLQTLQQLQTPSLIYAPEVDPRLLGRYRSATLHFPDSPLDMDLVAAQCDAAILNGTSATVVQMLVAGKPTLQIPLVLEQVYNARAVQRTGSGLVAAPNQPADVREQLIRLVGDKTIAASAGAFSKTAAARAQPISAVADRLLALLEG